MKVSIYSRKNVEELLKNNFPDNTAVISFYDPIDKKEDSFYKPVDYLNKPIKLFQVAVHDADLSYLPKCGLTYDTYFPEVDDLANFIYTAKEEGLDILCQCEYGESRSSACAAAILEHFYQQGLSIFTDYRYYPNQVIYHKIFDALNKLYKLKSR